MPEPFSSRQLPAQADTIAPDGSEIRLLQQNAACSMVHCQLAPGAVSMPVQHRSVEELWVFIAGRGQVWRKQGRQEELLEVAPGTSLSIPLGTAFQFRNTGEVALEFIISTSPPWPGDDEAVPLPAGKWDTVA